MAREKGWFGSKRKPKRRTSVRNLVLPNPPKKVKGSQHAVWYKGVESTIQDEEMHVSMG